MKENNNFNNFNDSFIIKNSGSQNMLSWHFQYSEGTKEARMISESRKLSFKGKDDCLFLIATKFYKMQTNV